MSKIRPMYVIEPANTKESKGLCRKTPYVSNYVTRYYFQNPYYSYRQNCYVQNISKWEWFVPECMKELKAVGVS